MKDGQIDNREIIKPCEAWVIGSCEGGFGHDVTSGLDKAGLLECGLVLLQGQGFGVRSSMDRVLPSEGRGCWFDPSRTHQ